MARMSNPMFRQTGSPLDGLNSGVAALFQSLMSQPSAADRAKSQAEMDYLRARTAAAQNDVRMAQGQQVVGQQIADLFVPQEAPRPNPEFVGPMPQRPVGDVLREGLPSVYGNAMSYGMKPADVASTVMGMAPWLNPGDATLANAYVGTGKPLAPNDAFSLEGQDAIASRNAGHDLTQALAVERAKPVGVSAGEDVYFGAEEAGTRGLPTRLSGRDTETTARGGAFNRLDPDLQAYAVGPTETEVKGGLIADSFFGLDDLSGSQREVLGANPDVGTPRNYITPSNQQGVTLDGVHDAATGEPIPAGSQVSTAQIQPTDPSGLRPNVVGNIQEGQLALADFKTVLGQAREVAQKDPSLFGFTGNVRRTGQGIIQQGNALASLLGAGQFDEVAMDLQRAGVAPEFFDPNLNDIEKLATLTAYQAAAALAGQTGRGLSDNDFKKFRTIIGDPTAWLSDQQSFLAGLDRVESLAIAMHQNRQEFLGQGGAPAPAPQDSGISDAMTPPASDGVPVYDINGNRVR